jgi:hypothetical protein
MTRSFKFLGVLVAVATAAGCGPTVGQQAAVGLSRLAIRNLGAVATALNADTSCGFSSTAVLGAAQLVGNVGGQGTFRLTVDNCTLDFGTDKQLGEPDCEGGTTKASGKVTVSGTREVVGTLTGSATNPVIPSGPDAVTITISKAEFTDYKIVNSKSQNILTLEKGSFAGVIKPRLAVNNTNGACSVSTPNTAFSGVKFLTESTFAIESDNNVTGTISSSDLSAQNGKGGDGSENVVKGSIEVSSRVGFLPPLFKQTYAIPPDGDDRGLDPDYSADAFQKSYQCNPALASPESFSCANLTPLLADGAARLTAKLYATVASMADKNTTCGFSSPMASASFTGETGDVGSLTLTIPDCVIEVPAGTELTADCAGVKTVVGGKVTVRGTKTVAGRLTGQAMTPVIPMSDSPATLAVTLTFENFKVGDTGGPNALLAKSGTLTGSLQPRVALATDTGACSITSSIARFNNLVWADASLAVTSASGTIDLPVSASSLNAVNGTWGADSNTLTGTMTVGGQALTVPSDNAGLNPAFNQAEFDASWTCAPNLFKDAQMAPSHQCVFLAPLAQGVARLSPRTVGTVLSIINADTTCGFSATGATAPTATLPATADLGKDNQTLVQTITTPCVINFTTETEVSRDCNMVTTRVQGSVSVTGTKTVRGFFTGDPAAPIVPTSRDPGTFALTMAFTNFKVLSSASTSNLTIKDGTVAATVTPRTGQDLATGACSKSTPVVTFDGITFSNSASVTLVSDGRTFNLEVGASDLDAQNGTKDAVSNRLTGSITVDGAALSVPTPGADDKLDPAFVQATFDSAYTCDTALRVPVAEAECNFRGVLATGVARLLVKDVGNALSLLDRNNTCGFTPSMTNATFAAPVLNPATPTAGQPASITLTSSNCMTTAPTVEVPSCITTPAALTSSYSGAFTTTTAVKAVNGVGTGNPASPVAPVMRTASQFNITGMSFAGFSAFDSGAAVTTTQKLTLVSGSVDVQVNPIGGQSIGSSMALGAPVYSISTPVARFTNLTATNVVAMLQNGPKYFQVTINTSDLDAFNGSFDMSTNELGGSITLDGQAFTLPTNPADVGLSPTYSQTQFDAYYACTPDLTATVPPEAP